MGEDYISANEENSDFGTIIVIHIPLLHYIHTLCVSSLQSLLSSVLLPLPVHLPVMLENVMDSGELRCRWERCNHPDFLLEIKSAKQMAQFLPTARKPFTIPYEKPFSINDSCSCTFIVLTKSLLHQRDKRENGSQRC